MIQIKKKLLIKNIEKYGTYFDISDIIEKLGLTLPLNFRQIDDLKYKLSSSTDIDFLEKFYYILQIYTFLYCEKCIEYYENYNKKLIYLSIKI